MTYQRIDHELTTGNMILLDGGTGTELERRGIEMDPDAWCGPATLDNLGTLKQIHTDYVDAGADVITANTFASSRIMLANAGLADQVAEINKAAIGAAQDVANGRNVAVAGSLSHMIPVIPGTDINDVSQVGSAQSITDALFELAELHKSEGCDLIVLEMMYAPDRVKIALAAALSTGLPIWAGFSVRHGEGDQILGFSPHDAVPLVDLVALLAGHPVAAAGVMHSPSNLIAESLNIVQAGFDGPLMAYPDSGYFKMPKWQFDNIIPPDVLQEYARGWLQKGTQIVGGCCGISPNHIAALNELR